MRCDLFQETGFREKWRGICHRLVLTPATKQENGMLESMSLAAERYGIEIGQDTEGRGELTVFVPMKEQ